MTDPAKSGDALREAVFSSIARVARTEFATLCAEHVDEIASSFRVWRRPPEDVTRDPLAMQHYGYALLTVAQELARLGRPEAFNELSGGGFSNPENRWGALLQDADRLADSGRLVEGKQLLLQVLSEMDVGTGDEIRRMRPKVMGVLGAFYFRDHEMAEALKWTEQAFQACINIRDEEGVRTYRQSLQTLRALHDDRQNPEMRERILGCRERIVSAQGLSDRGKYEASNAILLGILSTIGDSPAAELNDYLAKACGLIGWNYYYLKDPRNALRFTERALACCRATSDGDGVRVYEANLKAIGSSDTQSQG